MFFVLSGFVMALSYGRLFCSFSPRAFAGFLRRRIARLYPPYGAILVARLAYTAWHYRRFDLPRPWIAAPLPYPWTDIPANLLLVQSWGLAPSSIGPAWSISTEWAAYWAFPLLASCMLHRGPRPALAGAAAALGLLLGTAVLLHADGQPRLLDAWDGRTAGPLMRCLAGFILGLGVQRLSLGGATARLAGRPEIAWGLLLLLAGLLAVQASDLAVYALFPPLVLCLACGTRGPVWLFASASVVWLGEVSYSTYLLHIFLLHPLDQVRASARLFLPSASADLLAATLILIFLLAASHVTYQLIERPGRRALAGSPRLEQRHADWNGRSDEIARQNKV